MARIPWNEVENAERRIDGMHELSVNMSDSPIANEDIVPVPVRRRTWDWWHIACLWVGMSVCIPTYMLAAGLMSSGMSYKAALATILVGNAIVLIPMILNAHAGTKYGVPFPVLIRSSFGVTGAHVPSILRGLVACGWFGIQTWIGGLAIYVMIRAMWGGIETFGEGMVPAFLGINAGQLACFLFFWALHMLIVWAGVDSIKKVEVWAAPILIIIGIALGVWAWQAGGGFFRVLDASSHFATPDVIAVRLDETNVRLTVDLLNDDAGHPRATGMRFAPARTDAEAKALLADRPFHRPERELVLRADPDHVAIAVELERQGVEGPVLAAAIAPVGGAPARNWWFVVFLPLLTAMVGYWATLSLNIPDFTRFAKSQKDQMLGQAIGLPTTMTGYAFIGVFVTCASLIIFPNILVASQAPWDPVQLLGRFSDPKIVILAMFGLALATISTNIAANVVAPAVGFSNLAPHRISFKMGGYITGIIGLLMMPWKLLATAGDYIFTWLIGYSALLGGIAGVMLADYYVLRRARIDLLDLYRPEGRYRGVNKAGMTAFVLGVLPNIPGFLAQVALVDAASVPEFLKTIYTYAWFVSFAVSFVAYLVLVKTWPVDTSTRNVLEG